MVNETVGKHLKHVLKQNHPPVPATELFDAGERIKELEATNAGLLEALEMLLFSTISAEHGRIIAHHLEENNWSWPDEAPRFVNATHDNARKTIKKAKETAR